jgi:hypothetical protein
VRDGNRLPFADPLHERQEPALNGRLRTLSAGRRTGGARLCRRDSSCSAARIPAQDLGSGPQPPGGRSATRMRVRHLHRSRLRYFTAVQAPPAVRIMFLTSGAKGTRTPDPLVANNRQHVHQRPFPQVTVPRGGPASLQIRVCCGTPMLYRTLDQGTIPSRRHQLAHTYCRSGASSCHSFDQETRRLTALTLAAASAYFDIISSVFVRFIP